MNQRKTNTSSFFTSCSTATASTHKIGDEMDWPVIELCAPKHGILAHFSSGSGETVAHVLIRELVERVDRPTPSDVNCFSNDQEVEWVMQVVNHALALPVVSTQCYETLRAAVRIYLAWASALTAGPHDCCPKQLLRHPDRYFRKILEAFRHIFLDKPLPEHATDASLCLSRQSTQCRTILTAIRHLTSDGTVLDEFKDECWARSLLFLINATDQLLSIEHCRSQDSIGFLMAGDLCAALFDCWLQAALSEFIPSPSYWRTLSSLSWRCLYHVPFVECWAQSLLQLTVVLLRHQYGQEFPNIHIDYYKAFDNLADPGTQVSADQLTVLKSVWLEMFTLLGNPAQFAQQMFDQIDARSLSMKPVDLTHFAEQTSLAFFLAVLAFKKMVDLFFDDSSVCIDFGESEELHSQWMEALLIANERQQQQLQNEMDPHHQQQTQQQQPRLSNLSSVSQSVSVPCTPAPTCSVGAGRKSVALDFAGATTPELIAAVQLQLVAGAASRMRANQHVWYILKNNEFKQYTSSSGHHHPLSAPLFSVFVQWLAEPALFQLHPIASTSTNLHADSTQQQTQKSSLEEPVADLAIDPAIPVIQQRRSFATTTSASTSTITSSGNNNCYCSDPTMLGASPHQFHSPGEFPAVDGVSAGRSTALAALCRIVCAKHNRERLPDDQLAQFLAIAHEALISRDRLMLCALLYHTADELFKLALNGVQILLPNYLMAIDIVLTESLKLRLHPSVSQTDMRSACLRALASVLAWPSVFGTTLILDRRASGRPTTATASRLASRRGSSSSNMLECDQHYTDLRARMQRVLVHTVRTDPDPSNVQHALALATLFCAESARYDLQSGATDDERLPQPKENGRAEKETGIENTDGAQTPASPTPAPPSFSVSLVRAVISAVCDTLCKPGWANDTLCCLAAFDCLNSLSSLSPRVLFHGGELSTGSLVITSLCRFVDLQLRKPPPHHSRDMHSTVVAAYQCMNTWLTSSSAGPALARVESCLHTVAHSIELGMTGGRDFKPEQYKPASQRVHDAAELLLHSLFANASNDSAGRTAIDEHTLVQKFGLELGQFRHFLVGESTILSLYDVQQIPHLSNGLLTVIAVFRTPFYDTWATLVQLVPRAKSRDKEQLNGLIPDNTNPDSAQSPGCMSMSELLVNGGGGNDKRPSVASDSGTAASTATNGYGVKQFEMPSEVLRPQCKLDHQFPRLDPAPAPVRDIQAQLSQIRTRLAQGCGAPVGDRDARNVWLNASLGALLTRPPLPENPVARCNSLRVFLYDMGLVNRRAFGKEFTPLDNSSFNIFYDSMRVTVDQYPVRLAETASLFYVREGQRSAEDILQNNINLKQTSPAYCRLLSQLGKPVTRKPYAQVSKFPPPSPGDNNKNNGGTYQHQQQKMNQHHGFVLDGLEHYIGWRNGQVEIAFITPTGRMQTHAVPTTHFPAFNGGVQQVAQQQPVPTEPVLHPHQQLSTRRSIVLGPNSATASGSKQQLQNTLGPDNVFAEPLGLGRARTRSCASANSTEAATVGTTTTAKGSPLAHAKRSPDQRIFIVWLERLEDMDHFPIEDMFQFTPSGTSCMNGPAEPPASSGMRSPAPALHRDNQQQSQPIIDHFCLFLVPVERGLVRVQSAGVCTKYGLPGPLLNGTVVSDRALPALLRQTICSVARRKTVELENYQMNHLRRRQAIAEFGRRFASRLSYTDFVEQLISDGSC